MARIQREASSTWMVAHLMGRLRHPRNVHSRAPHALATHGWMRAVALTAAHLQRRRCKPRFSRPGESRLPVRQLSVQVCAALDSSRRLRMDRDIPKILPTDLYDALGSGAAPIVVDVRSADDLRASSHSRSNPPHGPGAMTARNSCKTNRLNVLAILIASAVMATGGAFAQ